MSSQSQVREKNSVGRLYGNRVSDYMYCSVQIFLDRLQLKVLGNKWNAGFPANEKGKSEVKHRLELHICVIK